MTNTDYLNAKILIVDDKESNIEILEGLLEEMGCMNFKSTTNSLRAISLFKSFQPDLLLLDIMMPNLSGFEIMEELKTVIPSTTYLPILVLTADISNGTKIKALSAGAKDFISKPFDLYEVSLRIRNLLETRFLHQQIETQNKLLETKVKERTFEVEKAYFELEKANLELKVLDHAKLSFLSLISHEIRTPLNGILGFTDILKDEVKSPKLLNYLQDLEASANRLERFSYQALLITELSTQVRKISSDELSLNKLFSQSGVLLEEKIKSKNLKVVLLNDQLIPSIFGEEKLIQLCFNYLIDNAITYSVPDKEVLVKITSDGSHTFCEFIDQGPGFSALNLENLYKVFALADEHIDSRTGLSLVLIKLIMDAHKGQVTITNNDKKGATVRLTFINRK